MKRKRVRLMNKEELEKIIKENPELKAMGKGEVNDKE